VRTHGALDDALVKTAPCVFRVNGALARLATPFYQRERLPLVLLSQGRPWSCNRTPHGGAPVLSCTLTPGKPDYSRRELIHGYRWYRCLSDHVTAERYPGGAREHRGRNGLQAHARMSYSSSHPGVGRIWRRPWSMPRDAAWRSQPVHATAIGPIPGYVRGVLRLLQERGDTLEPVT